MSGVTVRWRRYGHSAGPARRAVGVRRNPCRLTSLGLRGQCVLRRTARFLAPPTSTRPPLLCCAGSRVDRPVVGPLYRRDRTLTYVWVWAGCGRLAEGARHRLRCLGSQFRSRSQQTLPSAPGQADAPSPCPLRRRSRFQRSRPTPCPCLLTSHPVNEDLLSTPPTRCEMILGEPSKHPVWELLEICLKVRRVRAVHDQLPEPVILPHRRTGPAGDSQGHHRRTVQISRRPGPAGALPPPNSRARLWPEQPIRGARIKSCSPEALLKLTARCLVWT